MNKDLLKSVAAGTSFYEMQNGDDSLTIEFFEGVIDLYLGLCDGNKDSIDRVVEAITADKEFGYEYFYEDEAETFLEKHGDEEE